MGLKKVWMKVVKLWTHARLYGMEMVGDTTG